MTVKRYLNVTYSVRACDEGWGDMCLVADGTVVLAVGARIRAAPHVLARALDAISIGTRLLKERGKIIIVEQ